MATRKWFKIGAGAGIGVVSVVSLFLFLNLTYGFEIKGTDDICAGTLSDPCISYVSVKNPTSFNVDVYNQESVKLKFSPEIPEYYMFRQDSRCKGGASCAAPNGVSMAGWNYIDFTPATKPAADKEYVFRFPRYSTKEFLVWGLKNNPNDRIKWDFITEKGILDPVWLPEVAEEKKELNATFNVKAEKKIRLSPKFTGYKVISATGNESEVFDFEYNNQRICFVSKLPSDGMIKRDNDDKVKYKLKDSYPLFNGNGFIYEKDIVKDLIDDKYCFDVDDPKAHKLMKFGLNSIIVEWTTTYGADVYDDIYENTSGVNIEVNDTSIIAYYTFDVNNSYSDSTNYSNGGTCTTCPTFNSSGKFGGAYEFRGSGDTSAGQTKITTQNTINFTDAVFTISFWVKTNNNTQGSQIITNIGSGRVSTQLSSSGIFQTLTNNDAWQDSSNTPIPINTWVHLVWVYNGSRSLTYVNGSLNKNITDNSPTDANAALNIGVNAATNYGFNGSIDEITIWNRSLNSNEISSLYQNQTSRYYSSGELEFFNLDFEESDSGSFTFDNCDTYLQSSIEVATADDAQTVSDCSISSFFFGLADRYKNVTFILNADGTYRFYSPSFLDNITIDHWETIDNLTFEADRTTATIDNSNLTANYSISLASGDISKNMTNFLLGGSYISVLNLPFETTNHYVGTGTALENLVNRALNGTEANGVVYNSTGGYDRWGAYEFDGNDDYISVPANDLFNFSTNNFTLSVWAKLKSGSAADVRVLSKGGASGQTILFGMSSGAYTLYLNGVSYGSGGDLRDNSWHHLVATRNGTLVSLYKDGVVVDTDDTGTVLNVSNNNNLLIGTISGGGQFWNGTIDEVMVFNRSLSADQIYALYSNKTNILSSDETAIGNNWSIEIMAFVNSSGNVDLRDRKTSGTYTITQKPTVNNLILLSTSNESNGSSENLTVRFDTTSTIAVKNITDWRLNNNFTIFNMPFERVRSLSNNMKDYSINKINGSCTSCPTWNNTGGYDRRGAYEFDGLDDYINITGIQKPLGEFTISLWIYPNTLASLNTIFAEPSGSDSSVNGNKFIRVNSDGTMYMARWIGQSSNQARVANNIATDIVNNQWQFITITYSGGTNGNWSVYKNSVAITTPTSTSSSSYTHIGSTIGGLSGKTQVFNGTIDDIVIFNRSLSADQIYVLYNNKTNILSSDETNIGDNWTVVVTANDGNEDSDEATDSLLITSCSCPNPSANWQVNMSDNCILQSVCNLTNYNISTVGSGSWTVNSTLYVDSIQGVVSGAVIWLKNIAQIWVSALK